MYGVCLYGRVRLALLGQGISQRYERGSTVLTSNLPFDEWTEGLCHVNRIHSKSQ